MKFVIFVLAILSLISCSDNEPTPIIDLKVKNNSSIDFDDIAINTSDVFKSFGPLTSSAISDSRMFEGGDVTLFIKLTTIDKSFDSEEDISIDEGGIYTLNIDIDSPQCRMIYSLVKD